jgi:hypothetical protein
MTTPPRRVVTGHDAQGKSIVLSDGAVPHVLTRGTMVDFAEIWATAASPAPITADEPEPTDDRLLVSPAPGGVKFRINDFEPGHVKSLKPRADGRHPMMHRTKTIDFGIVLEGEIHLILDDSEVLLREHDVVIQRGTDHAWENRTDRRCRVAFILIDGAWDADLRASLPDDLELRH